MNTRRIAFRAAIVLVLATMLLSGLVLTVHAAVFVVDDGIIAADQVIDDDVFMAGDRIVVEGTIKGNLFALGGEILVNGTVEGSLFAVGLNVQVNGVVEGSIFGSGSSIVVGSGAQVGRNLLVGSYALSIQPGASVAKDVFVGGYQAQVIGRVGGDFRANVSALDIVGTIGGDVYVDVGAPGEVGGVPRLWAPPGVTRTLPPGLRVSPGARIEGQLIYTSPVPQDAAVGIEPGGGLVYRTPVPDDVIPEPPPEEDWTIPSLLLAIGRWILARVREFVTLLILGGLALRFIPAIYVQTMEELRREPWWCLGWGFLTWVAGFVAVGLLFGLVAVTALFIGFITLGELSRNIAGLGFSALSLAFFAFLILVQYGTKLVVALALGRLLMEGGSPRSYIKPDYDLASGGARWVLPTDPSQHVGAWLLGIVVYVLLRGIPFLGWIVGLFATLFGLGAIARRYYEWRKWRAAMR